MRVYVGNIAYTTTEDELRDLFAPFGPVDSVSIITDRETGRSKGFAFINIDGDINQITTQLNGAMLNGRALKVSEAQERQPRGGVNRGNGGGFRGNRGGNSGRGGFRGNRGGGGW